MKAELGRAVKTFTESCSKITGIYYNILYTTNILGIERKIPLGGKPYLNFH